MPTTSTFLQLFRMITLYYPTRKILRGSNVDNEDDNSSIEQRLTVLTTYKDWMINGYKENKKKTDALKSFVKDTMLKGIQVELEEQNCTQNPDKASMSDNLVYYIAGYLVFKCKSRCKCEACKKSVDTGLETLPPEFTAKDLTVLKNRGNLRFASTNMYRLLLKVENLILAKINAGEIFSSCAFTDIITALCDEKLPQVGCNQHKEAFMTTLIVDYMCSRMKCIAKQANVEVIEVKRSKAKTLRKVSML